MLAPRKDEMLGEVSVLILIDKYISEEILIVPEDIGIIAQQDIHIVEDIVEIHCVGQTASLAVDTVDLADHRTLGAPVSLIITSVGHIRLGPYQRVFGIRDGRGDHGRAIDLVVKVKVADDHLDERLGVSGVIDGEIRFEP